MNKRFFIFSAAILAFAGMSAQTSGIDAVLQQIEANNKELQANSHLISSQKLENKTNNNLPDPTLSYAHLWDSKNSDETVGEMVISQSFDFPTLYATRGKMNRLKTNALDAQATAFRQQILLQAKEVCLDIIMLQRQQALLDERLKNAEELSAMYTRRLETGDANALETNKINLELLNVRTEARMNQTALNNKLKELLVLNGNQPLTPGRPRPGTTPNAQTLGLTEYPAVPLPADFHPLADELLASDPTLQSLQGESSAARKQISASKHRRGIARARTGGDGENQHRKRPPNRLPDWTSAERAVLRRQRFAPPDRLAWRVLHGCAAAPPDVADGHVHSADRRRRGELGAVRQGG